MKNKEFWKGFVEGFIKGVVLLAIGFCIGFGYCYKVELRQLVEANEFKRELITNYENYYNNVESFLDELDDKYDWVDAFDPEYYYLSKEKLDSLYRSEL